ncbi:hypothetical protein KC669_04015 [Candidatus Dojkabacteria bacterium]|uniref:DUF4190 domain-containing protein n=1 Tax=Candidatus Dojkabacteria bacterium TaxID=2099670 RepID=A0A955LBF5_9BACT|nr:hypothetical protein [Candidatus Dojkabacteria bacterium]
MKKINKILIILSIILTAPFAFVSSVNAQYGVCDFLPCGDSGVLPTPGDTTGNIEFFISIAVGLVFTGFIAFGIFIIIKSALKIIQSEGDESKVEESAGAIKSVFIGLGMLIMGIIGIVVLLSLFNAGGLVNSPVEKPEGVNEVPLIN